jgi:hypothetical protein
MESAYWKAIRHMFQHDENVMREMVALGKSLVDKENAIYVEEFLQFMAAVVSETQRNQRLRENIESELLAFLTPSFWSLPKGQFDVAKWHGFIRDTPLQEKYHATIIRAGETMHLVPGANDIFARRIAELSRSLMTCEMCPLCRGENTEPTSEEKMVE